jgi:hypothetical protein
MMLFAVYNHWTPWQVVLLALVCLTKVSCGFNTATTLPSVTAAPSVLTSKAFILHNRWEVSSSKKCPLQLRAHRDDDSTTYYDVGHYSSCRNCSSLRSGALFPQRHRMMHTSRLQMTTTPNDANNDISDDNSLLVRVWLKLRMFMARLWVGHIT